MALNKNWARWIFASVSKHFANISELQVHSIGTPIASGKTALYIEGQPRDSDALIELIELRIDGPHFKQLSKSLWKVIVEVSTVIQVIKTETNFHRLQELIGVISSKGFTRAIEVYRYGKTDDGASLGCLELINPDLEIHQFGQIDPSTRLHYATIEGNYRIYLGE